jgi:thymidylate kinase
MIICLEGIDGCGKTTQAQALATALDGRVIAFPDYTSESGTLIHANLAGYWRADADPRVNALVLQSLMLTNRMEHAPAIAATPPDQHVVFARYWPSGIVYGGADGLDHEWLLRIHAHLPPADLWILLDVDAEQSAERRPDRRDRYEAQPGLMADVARRYREFWAEMRVYHGDAWRVVDARGAVEPTAAAIWSAIRPVISPTASTA